jgi:hypothetical protein
MIVFGEAHLRRILRGYAAYYAYYYVSRTHRSLNKDAPLQRAVERLGTWCHGLSSGVDSHYVMAVILCVQLRSVFAPDLGRGLRPFSQPHGVGW